MPWISLVNLESIGDLMANALLPIFIGIAITYVSTILDKLLVYTQGRIADFYWMVSETFVHVTWVVCILLFIFNFLA